MEWEREENAGFILAGNIPTASEFPCEKRLFLAADRPPPLDLTPYAPNYDGYEAKRISG
jgi:hypothetical protein